MTFVKTKLELEELAEGDVLEVLLREGEPVENVAASCRREGYTVEAREPAGAGIWRLRVRP